MLELSLDALQLDLVVEYFDGWWPERAVEITVDQIAADAQIRIGTQTEAPDGSAWEPWSESYAKTRGPEHKLLKSSGDLMESLESKMRGDRGEVVSDLEYALVHQFGSKDERIKARPYAGVSDDLESALEELFAEDFDRGWRAIAR